MSLTPHASMPIQTVHGGPLLGQGSTSSPGPAPAVSSMTASLAALALTLALATLPAMSTSRFLGVLAALPEFLALTEPPGQRRGGNPG